MNTTPALYDTFPQLKLIPTEKFPKHVLIIPDGNGRWAEKSIQFVLFGHKKGAEVIKSILRVLSQIKSIEIITLWGFSSDNWKRSEKEVKGLLYLIQIQIEQALVEVMQRNARFIHLGRKDRIPSSLLEIMTQAENATRNNTGQIICIAVDFGGEDQEIRLLQKAHKLPESTIFTKQVLWDLRDGEGVIPPADLLIRTAGEHRTSDIGWLNGAPTELYFIDKLFPDITTQDIVNGIISFSNRNRRFGARIK